MLAGGVWDHLIDNSRRVYDPNYLSPTLTAHGGGNHEVKIAVECVGNCNPSGNGMNGNVFSPTLTTNKGEGLKIVEPVALRMVRTEGGIQTIQRLEVAA